MLQGSPQNFLEAPQSQRAFQRCTKRLYHSSPLIKPSQKQPNNCWYLFHDIEVIKLLKLVSCPNNWSWNSSTLLDLPGFYFQKYLFVVDLSGIFFQKNPVVDLPCNFFFKNILFWWTCPFVQSIFRSCLRSSKSWWNPKLKILLDSCQQICKDKVHHQSPYFSPIFRCASKYQNGPFITLVMWGVFSSQRTIGFQLKLNVFYGH